MALGLGESRILASAFVTEELGEPGQIQDGTPQFVFGCGVNGGAVVWNNGNYYSDDQAQLRQVLPSADPSIVGKCIQVTGGGSRDRGTVIAAIQIELGTTGGTGALSECVYVIGNDGHYFIALTSDVEEVPC